MYKRFVSTSLLIGWILCLNFYTSWAGADETQNGVTPETQPDTTRNISAVDVIWTSGELADHIFGNQTFTYDTDSIVAPAHSQLEFKYGLWNSPDVTLEVRLNGVFLGSVVADQGYISPGPEFMTWDVTSILQDGINDIEVHALPSAGEAIVGAFTIFGEGTAVEIDITAVPNPATVGFPLDILLDLENPGDGFNAVFRLWVLASGNVTTLVSLSPFVEKGLVLTGVNIFSTGSVPAGLPSIVGFLAAIFEGGSGELLAWDFESLGIGVAPSAIDITALRQAATAFLNSGDVNAAPTHPTQELDLNGTAKNSFGQQVNSKGKLTTTWGRIKSQR